jgi:hypothetical protein
MDQEPLKYIQLSVQKYEKMGDWLCNTPPGGLLCLPTRQIKYHQKMATLQRRQTKTAVQKILRLKNVNSLGHIILRD